MCRVLFLITMLFPVVLFSQVTLSGTLVNSDKNPVEFAEVQLLVGDSIVAQKYSDELGAFDIQAVVGDYTLQVKIFDSIVHRDQINLNSDKYLEPIIISSTVQLDEVTISYEKKTIEKKVDRLVFNVDKVISVSGGDAVDVLRIAPKIKVVNDGISMIGKSGVTVMIDGKLIQLAGQDLFDYLRSIKADDIKKLEVLTNPPAKYSAQGNSGLINIITKKGRSESWNSSVKSVYQQATYPTGALGASFNLRSGKLEVLSALNYTEGSKGPVESSVIDYPDIKWEESNNRRDYTDLISGRFGVNYRFSDKLYAGILYNSFTSRPKVIDNVQSLLHSNDTGALENIIITNGDNRTKRTSNTLNYHMEYKLDTIGTKINLDYDYFDLKVNANRIFSSNIYDNNMTPVSDSYQSASNSGEQKIFNNSVNVDVESPKSWAELNYGARLSFIKTKNQFEYFDIEDEPVFNPELSNAFLYKENIFAMYFSAQREIGDKWEAKAGLRWEMTYTEGNSITLGQVNNNNYNKIFPTAYLLYNINDRNSMSLNYGRRINRPNFQYLNPFRWVSSPFSYSEGNPYLQPAFSQNIELEYAYDNSYISSLFFSYLEEGFEQVVIVDPNTNIQQTIPQNYIGNKTLGFSQIANIDILNWVRTNVVAYCFYSVTNSKIPVVLASLKGWNSEFTVSADFDLNKAKTWLLNLSYNYSTGGVSNLDRVSASNQLNMSMRVNALKNKLNISLIANDITSSYRPVYYTYSNGIKTSFKNYYDFRYLRLSLIYSFGDKLNVKQNQAKNNEEVRRSQ